MLNADQLELFSAKAETAAPAGTRSRGTDALPEHVRGYLPTPLSPAEYQLLHQAWASGFQQLADLHVQLTGIGVLLPHDHDLVMQAAALIEARGTGRSWKAMARRIRAAIQAAP